jgi:hypothetical protein
MKRAASRALLIVMALATLGSARAVAFRQGVPCRGCWTPPQHVDWQWQLAGKLDRSVPARVFDIDLFENSAKTVRSLHRSGRHVVCYLDAGTWERWRPDAARFPRSVLGKGNGWPGERWLDIRRLDVLRPIMRSRIALCARRGFDAVEFDNVDGYANDTGFPLTAGDQLAFNRWLANEAHRHGLSAALKNDLGQVRSLLPWFDFALDEQCFQYHECARLRPFVRAGKAVFEVEYRLKTSSFCGRARRLGFDSMRKHLRLDAWRSVCRRTV